MIRFRGAARVAAAVGVFYCVSSESSDDVIVVVVTAATHVDTYEIAAVKIVSPLNFCSIFFFDSVAVYSAVRYELVFRLILMKISSY